jgi:N-acetyl-beta-hexosaminidase
MVQVVELSRHDSLIFTWKSMTASLRIAAIAAIIAGLTFLVTFSLRPSTLRPTPATPLSPSTPIPSVSTLNEQMTRLTQRLDALSQPSSAAQVSAQLGTVSATVGDLQHRLSALEGAIVQAPDKALEIPLLRKDLDDLKNQDSSAISALEQNISRQYDLMKWVLGTFVLGLGALVFSVYKANKAAK